MNISRGFILSGSLYLLVGIVLGSYMGGSGDHSLTPVHAHINLLGFTLMTIFGLVYRSIPELTRSRLSLVHFWLFQIGALSLLISLYLLIGGVVDPAKIGPFMPVVEGIVLLGTLAFVVNLWRSRW